MVANLARMTEPKKHPPKPPTNTARMPKALVRRIARVAAHLDVSVPDYLADRLAPIVDADEAKMLEELKRERGEKGKK